MLHIQCAGGRGGIWQKGLGNKSEEAEKNSAVHSNQTTVQKNCSRAGLFPSPTCHILPGLKPKNIKAKNLIN